MSRFICVDIETLSVYHNAVIVSISAVKFSLNNDEIEKFSVNINPKDGIKLGLHVSQDTLDWWKRQGSVAVNAWKHSQIGLSEGLDLFDKFIGDEDLGFMANGMAFDFPILESSYRALNKKIPFKYWKTYDMRTIYWAAGFDTKTAPRVGTYHVGIDDCLTQISWLKQCMKTA